MSMFVQPLGFMEGLGGSEMLLVMVVILVLFGGDKLPEFARGAGKLIREFKKASSNVEDEFKRALEDEDRKKTIAPIATAPLASAPAIEAPSTAEMPALLDSPPAPLDSTPPSPKPASPPPPPKMLPGESGDQPI